LSITRKSLAHPRTFYRLVVTRHSSKAESSFLSPFSGGYSRNPLKENKVRRQLQTTNLYIPHSWPKQLNHKTEGIKLTGHATFTVEMIKAYSASVT